MNAQPVTDQELIGRYLAGNQSSLELLIRRHKNRIFAYILMIVKDKELAEDLFQDTFIKVINTIRSGSYKEEGKFIQWVMRIAHNLIIDYFRKAKRIPIVDGPEVRHPGAGRQQPLLHGYFQQPIPRIAQDRR